MFLQSLLVFLLLLKTAALTVTQQPASPACIDSQLTRTLEYESFVNYRHVDRGKDSIHACVMITQCSVDRLDRLLRQVKAWGGATSAAVYVPTGNDKEKLLKAIDVFMTSLEEHETYGGRLTVSVLFGHESTPALWNCEEPKSPGMPLYPINTLRNLAVAGTSTGAATATTTATGVAYSKPSYLFYLDVDFVPSAGLSAWIDKRHRNAQQHTHSTRKSKNMFYQVTHSGGLIVVPAFEDTRSTETLPQQRTVRYLQQGVNEGSVRPFHLQRYPPGHNATNYPRWQKLSFAQSTNKRAYKPYEVAFELGYEPYVIISHDRFVPYDERFRGYGLNKCMNLQWLAHNQSSFYVLPGHFVVEDAHANSVMFNRTSRNTRWLSGARDAVVQDMEAGRTPLVSLATAQLLRAAGYGAVATEDPIAHESYIRGNVVG